MALSGDFPHTLYIVRFSYFIYRVAATAKRNTMNCMQITLSPKSKMGKYSYKNSVHCHTYYKKRLTPSLLGPEC